MPLYCEICKRDRGKLNKTNWRRHIDSCKLKNTKRKEIITPPPSVFSISNYFSKKRKIEETIVPGM